MLFKELGLSAELLRAVDEQGYSTATPVQQQAIPPILAGRDILASAQTGTGKTAGFTLPLLQRLQQSNKPKRTLRALILTPTRELAAQITDSVRDYGRHLPFRGTMIFGGVSINPQITKLKRGVDIVVADEDEVMALVETRNFDDMLKALDDYSNLFAITRSAKGSVIVHGDEKVVQAAAGVKDIVDTTGAGDAYCAGFLFGWANDLPLSHCAQYGTHCATQVAAT